MRTLIAAAVLAVLAAPAAWAASEDEYRYVGASGGWFHPLNESTGNLQTTVARDAGPELHGAIGYQYKAFRAEAEGDWFYGGAGTHGDSQTGALMVNGYYDFDTGGPFVPYVGGGGGLAYVTFNGVSAPPLGRIDDTDVELAWQVLAGIGYRMNKDLTLYGGYRWFDVNNVTMHNQAGVRVKLDGFGSHNLEIGFRYRL